MAKITVKSRRFGIVDILVDDSDFNFLNQFKWYICWKKKDSKSGYAKNSRTNEPMHRMLLDLKDPKIYVDHINRNTIDNRRINLRLSNASTNQMNRIASGSSKYLGVTLQKIKYERKDGSIVTKIAWLSRIVNNGKQIYLGSFRDEKEAALCYDNAAKKMHKEFANLNFKIT